MGPHGGRHRAQFIHGVFGYQRVRDSGEYFKYFRVGTLTSGDMADIRHDLKTSIIRVQTGDSKGGLRLRLDYLGKQMHRLAQHGTSTTQAYIHVGLPVRFN